MAEQLRRSLQEDAITLLCHSDEHGKVIANLIDASLYEGDFRVIAERAIDYWRQQHQAPKSHLDDLLSDILDDPKNLRAKTFRRIMIAMLQLNDGINATYVMSQLSKFVRMQKLKGAILRSAEQINAQQELAIEEIEKIWNTLLRSRDIAFDSGIRLVDPTPIIEFMQQRHSEFEFGVKVLNDRYIVPYRGGVVLLIAPPGKGKSWFLIDTGWTALEQNKKVLHITLEMPAKEVGMRYYQRALSISKRQTEVDVSTFNIEYEEDDDGETKRQKLVGFDIETMHPEFTLESADLFQELHSHIRPIESRFSNIIIKQFPTRSLTLDGLVAFLDNLEITERFVPDMLILDYIGIMRTDMRDHRLSLGRMFEEFRGILIDRNIAGVTAHQVSREGAKAEYVSATHVAEDWSLIATADQVITYSSTDAEEQMGLGRLYVSKARGEEDKFGCVITQSYATGQFCVDSMYLPPKYFELLPKTEKDDEEASE